MMMELMATPCLCTEAVNNVLVPRHGSHDTLSHTAAALSLTPANARKAWCIAIGF